MLNVLSSLVPLLYLLIICLLHKPAFSGQRISKRSATAVNALYIAATCCIVTPYLF